MNIDKPLVSISNLKKYFNVNDGILKAVDNISMDIFPGETIGLVGESGCGKTTVGRTILRLYEPTAGNVVFDNEDVFKLHRQQLKSMRRKMQMIFQDPYASLDPRMTVQDIIGEALDIHKLAKGLQRKKQIANFLNLVGLKTYHMSRFPHEFSGGQRQRIGIARAIAVEPKFIVCDEPISALDVSIQAQIVNLLQSLQQKMGLTYLFISHDLSMVKFIANRVAVMYLGGIVELANSKDLYSKPLHPYTQALLSAVPIPDPYIEKKRKHIVLHGDVPSPINPPTGCAFCSRCIKSRDKCKIIRPSLKEGESNHFVACHYL